MEAEHYAYYEYLDFNGDRYFTVVMLPTREGRFPIVVCRSPYVQNTEGMAEDDIVQDRLRAYSAWLERGYAVVFQHCRGQGKSTGAFVPYIHEREDGLALRAWIREQSFYMGELYLVGGSYTASLHYTTAPFEEDIKGAVFEVQDSERYRLWYRNGQMRKGHANWHFILYKKKCGLNKRFSMASFSELPLLGLSERVLGDRTMDFEEMLEAESPSHPFWETRFGGGEGRNATDDANIPMLLTTGYNDFYLGGTFRMWERMSARTKAKSALLVSPYDHGDGYAKDRGLAFPMGRRAEQFGSTYQIDWIDHVRKGTPIPYEKGVVTYYRDFENAWASDYEEGAVESMALRLGKDAVSFCYDPKNPPTFAGEGGLQVPFAGRRDVVSVYTEPLDRDVFIKGRMKAELSVSSDAPDTSFYLNISIEKKEGYYNLRHDITSLCYQLGDYAQGSQVRLDFCFDEHAFLLRRGERLRIDIASTDNSTYVCHTNQKGPYYLQTETRTAVNTVYLDRSSLILPIEVG